MAYHSHFSEAKSIRRQTIKSLIYTVCITHSCSLTNSVQEFIRVRERILHIGPIPKVILLKLFLDIAPSSSTNITLASRACFRGGSVYVVSFRFKSKENL